MASPPEGLPFPLSAILDIASPDFLTIRMNNPMERLMGEIRRRTRVVGAFPDGNSALMLVSACLRHIASAKRDCVRYMNMARLYGPDLTGQQVAG